MAIRAHLVFYGGPILTMEPENPLAEALVVGSDGRILAVGRETEVKILARSSTILVNLYGRALLPGFFDCHMHILHLGLNLMQVDLSPEHAPSLEAIVLRLQHHLQQNPHLPCILGNRYDHNRLTPPEHPTKNDLDKVATDRPVCIEHTSGHAAVVNSYALQLLGITRDTPDPVGGTILRDAKGEPTGVLLETASWQNLEKIIPPPTRKQQREALKLANNYLVAKGITSASDACTSLDEVEVYALAAADGTLQVRVNSMLAWAEVMRSIGSSKPPSPHEFQQQGVSGHQFHVGQAKLFSDGAITTRTCRLSQPFQNMPNNYGLFLHPPEELEAYITAAHNAGWQIATHAIGDAAIDFVLSCYANAQRAHPRPRPAHRIEHCMLVLPQHIARLRRQHVWAIGQPEFLSQLGDAYIAALGEDRANMLSPYATLEAQGVAQAFSSDCPVVPGNPLDGVRAAVERKTPSGKVLNPSERVSTDVALYAYTAAPAYATRTDDDRGTLSAGKWADMVVLSENPTHVPITEWDRLQVVATIIGGRPVFGELA